MSNIVCLWEVRVFCLQTIQFSVRRVVSSGIRPSHREFNYNRAMMGARFCTSPCCATDCHGHGTHVAGTISGYYVGVSQRATLIGVKVLNDRGSGTTANVIRGVSWVVNEVYFKRRLGKSVINMSLGSRQPVRSLDAAVNAAVAKGIPVVVAAGNSQRSACGASPARAKLAITVASIGPSKRRSSFSNYGSCVDIFAPGERTYSAWHTSNTAYRTASGTSMAAPHVAGTVAVVLSQNNYASPKDVEYILYKQAASGVVNRGAGSPDRILQIDCDNTANMCQPNPCQNGGTCSNTCYVGYSCKCRPGFSGSRCQIGGCRWSRWSTWSQCYYGYQFRSRRCLCPRGGCRGSRVMYRRCSTGREGDDGEGGGEDVETGTNVTTIEPEMRTTDEIQFFWEDTTTESSAGGK